jgi:glycosyltransferase involved in cell wall biosynthesis
MQVFLNENYPKVLFITPCAFNRITGGGITFSNLFQGWPKERIATITGDTNPVTNDICHKYYFLTANEINYISPFGYFAKRSYGPAKAEANIKYVENGNDSNFITRFKRCLFGDAGIPDEGILSYELKKWIYAYQPQLIYSILGTPGYIDLVNLAWDELQIPIVIHLMDEGVTDPKRSGIFGSYLKQLYKRKLMSVLRRSSSRIAICQEMATEYSQRYNLEFTHFQNTIEMSKWDQFRKKNLKINDTPIIVYAGSVLPFNQQQSLKDCCLAIKDLNESGLSIQLNIYTPFKLLQLPTSYFEIHPAINVRPAPEDDATFFSILGDADALILPVNFDSESVHYIRLSMPTKVPAYLASGTPILVYGPAHVAQVNYASRYGWGMTVTTPAIEKLKKAMQQLVRDIDLRRVLSETAREVAKEFHDAPIVRNQFQNTLCELSQDNTSGPGL